MFVYIWSQFYPDYQERMRRITRHANSRDLRLRVACMSLVEG